MMLTTGLCETSGFGGCSFLGGILGPTAEPNALSAAELVAAETAALVLAVAQM